MFGKGVFQEEENVLRNIIRSIDKRVDYSAKEGEGSRFTVHVKLRNREADVILDLEDLKAAKLDMVRRHQIRQKIKARWTTSTNRAMQTIFWGSNQHEF